MELPIIVSNHGDAEIFASVAEVQDYLEAADVLDDEYVAYDSVGYVLSLFVKNGKIHIEDAESKILKQQELRELLTRYLAYVNVPLDWLIQATLLQLVEKRMDREKSMG